MKINRSTFVLVPFNIANFVPLETCSCFSDSFCFWGVLNLSQGLKSILVGTKVLQRFQTCLAIFLFFLSYAKAS